MTMQRSDRVAVRLGRSASGLLAALGLISIIAGPARAQERSDITLRIGSYGGAFTASQRKYVGDVFTQKTGIKVQYIDGSSSEEIAKLIASQGREPPFDIMYLVKDDRDAALGQGLIARLDPTIVTNLKYLYNEAQNPEGYGPGIAFYSVGIAYNYKKFEAAGIPAPTSWRDLWNPKLAGRVGIPHPQLSYGREFLLAVTKLLLNGDESTPEKGVDLISQIKAYSYYTSSAPLTAAFASGDVWVSPMINAQTWRQIDLGQPLRYVIPKEGGVGNLDTIDLVAGSPHPKEAQLYINMALGPLAQLGNATDNPLGPTNTLLVPILEQYPDQAQRFPASPTDLKQLYLPDWLKFLPHRDDVVDYWNHKMAQP